jgi:hypothetical protein
MRIVYRRYPYSARCERKRSEKDVLIIPDFIANAGGVICAAVEYHGGTQSRAFATIAEKIRANTEQVLGHSAKSGSLPRHVAMQLAERRVARPWNTAVKLVSFRTKVCLSLHWLGGKPVRWRAASWRALFVPVVHGRAR